jgi:TonB-dependent receptor
MDYDGRTVEYNRFGRFDSLKFNTATNSYMNLLPNARVSYQLNEQNSIHLAYSRSLKRPDFQMLNPFVLALPEDTLLYSGNTKLDPMVSDNFDLGWHYSLPEGGFVSINAFYKNVADYIQLVNDQAPIQLGEYSNYDDLFEDGETQMMVYRKKFQNTENTATIYGVEVEADKKLSFLPGLFTNLSAKANYTFSQAEFDGNRNETTDLPGHSPHVVNAALAYNQDKFSAQVSYHWTAKLLTNLQESTELAPSIGNTPVYLDRYQDGYSDLSATISYQISDNTELWANIYNLLSTEQMEFAEDRDLYPTSIYKRDGIEFNAGVRLTF